MYRGFVSFIWGLRQPLLGQNLTSGSASESQPAVPSHHSQLAAEALDCKLVYAIVPGSLLNR